MKHVIQTTVFPQTVSLPAELLGGRQSGDFAAVQIAGNDLFPLYQDGDILLLDRTTVPVAGDTVVVLVSGEMQIGRLEPTAVGITFQNLNPFFPPVQEGAFTVMGTSFFLMRQFRSAKAARRSAVHKAILAEVL